MIIEELFALFTTNFSNYKSDIYNEFSLQHELGIFLRDNLKDKGYKVQFERNVADLAEIIDGTPVIGSKTDFVKKEIDIVIWNEENLTEQYAIELKYPVNGEYPNQMFKFAEDISFMEQVKEKLKFTATYVFTMVKQDGFYDAKNKTDGIYAFFRGPNPRQLTGKIENPKKNGEKNTTITIKKRYRIKWETFKKVGDSQLRYYFLSI